MSKESSADSKDSKDSNSVEMDNIYHVKWIGWNSSKIPIITQNSNGPCPMLAIANILLLRGKMTLQDGCEIVSSEQLLETLGDTMLECVPKNIDSDRRLDYEANVSDAVILLPKLQTGIDVNVKFSGVGDFEYTSECIIFDLFNIALYHGWLVDPQQEDIVKAVDGLSYNQLVEKIIVNKHSSESALVSESLVAQTFLEESASQLTYHGLIELASNMKENELAIFFRNNHFSTIHKRKNELFLLVTDQGFLKEPSVVWETLNSIDGDGQFVDNEFITAPPKASPKIIPSSSSVSPTALSPDQQFEQDLQLAQALGAQQDVDQDWESFKENKLGDTSGLTDEELAKKLQDIEQSMAEQQQDEELARRLQEEENSQMQHEGAQQPPRGSSAASRSGTGATAATAAASSAGGSPSRNQSAASSSQRTKNCTIL